jgi:hypothetical protein
MTAGPGDTRGSQLLIGIDDTDNLGTRGTGHLAERLLLALRHAGFGSATGATRHQLLVDPQIPYTSHNSSMCIGWDGEPGVDAEAIAGVAGPFLETASAPGSDPGLAIAVAENWSDPRCRQELVDFGHRAKREVLNRSAAFALAALCGVSLSAHGGDGGGVIGALAAVGLHLSGDDGRFRWMPGLRDLAGFLSYDELPSAVPITEARDPTGREPKGEDVIDLGDWVRPVLRGSRSVLLLQTQSPVEAAQALEATQRSGSVTATWVVLSRDVVKNL